MKDEMTFTLKIIEVEMKGSKNLKDYMCFYASTSYVHFKLQYSNIHHMKSVSSHF